MVGLVAVRRQTEDGEPGSNSFGDSHPRINQNSAETGAGSPG